MPARTKFDDIITNGKLIEIRGFSFDIRDYDYSISNFGSVSALTKCDEKRDVYVGKSKLKIPSKYHNLIMYYASGIIEKHEVKMEKGGTRFYNKIVTTAVR